MKIINSEYRKKLNGYRCSHRNRWLLLSANILSLQALSLLEFYIDISDFDKNHHSYSTLEVNFAEIANIFSCSQSTIRNWHKELIGIKLIIPSSKRGYFKVLIPERYNSPGYWKGAASDYAKSEKDQPVASIFQSMKTGLQPTVESSHQVVKKSDPYIENHTPIAISSFKDESKYLTIDDKRWIDKTLQE